MAWYVTSNYLWFYFVLLVEAAIRNASPFFSTSFGTTQERRKNLSKFYEMERDAIFHEQLFIRFERNCNILNQKLNKKRNMCCPQGGERERERESEFLFISVGVQNFCFFLRRRFSIWMFFEGFETLRLRIILIESWWRFAPHVKRCRTDRFRFELIRLQQNKDRSLLSPLFL